MDKTPSAWAGDKLKRKLDAKHLREILEQRYNARRANGIGSYILNIDAAWGEGKTYFLKNLCLDLRSDGHAVAYVNAWQDDHSDQPMTTVIAAIEEQLRPFLSEGTKAQKAFDKAKAAAGIVMAETAKQVLFHVLKMTTGVGVEKVIKALAEGQQLDEDAFEAGADVVLKKAEAVMQERVSEHQCAKAAITIFRNRVSDTLASVEEEKLKRPFYVFVDELDRCRPLYAIRMLEDMKHLFEIDGVVFVIATDTAQLSNSVSAIYGEKFDGARYLRRFFDRVYVFPQSDKIDIIDHMFSVAGVSIEDNFFPTMGFPPIRIISDWVKSYQFSNRDLEYVVEIVSTFVTSWSYKVKIEPVNFFAHVGAFLKNPHYSLRDVLLDSGLSSWNLSRSEQAGYSSPDRMIKMKASDVVEAVNRIAEKPFSQLTASGEPLGQYFRHENMMRFSGGIPIEDRSPSIVSQYYERVKNAGRHLAIER